MVYHYNWPLLEACISGGGALSRGYCRPCCNNTVGPTGVCRSGLRNYSVAHYSAWTERLLKFKTKSSKTTLIHRIGGSGDLSIIESGYLSLSSFIFTRYCGQPCIKLSVTSSSVEEACKVTRVVLLSPERFIKCWNGITWNKAWPDIAVQ